MQTVWSLKPKNEQQNLFLSLFGLGFCFFSTRKIQTFKVSSRVCCPADRSSFSSSNLSIRVWQTSLYDFGLPFFDGWLFSLFNLQVFFHESYDWRREQTRCFRAQGFVRQTIMREHLATNPNRQVAKQGVAKVFFLLRFFVYFCVFNWAEILDHCLQLQMAYKLAINVETERWSFLLFRWLQHRGCREFHRKIEFLGVLIRTKQRLLKNSTQRWSSLLFWS